MTANPAATTWTGTTGGSTRDALVSAGLACFTEHGYSGSRLADIARGAGLTTGAFYRYFNGKLDFYQALFDEYADTLLAALNSSRTLPAQLEAWVEISRRYRGAIRAAAEVCRPDTAEAASRKRLRDTTANLLARHLTATGSWNETRTQASMVVDILDQYVMMEAAGWTTERNPADVAAALSRMVCTGLYVP